MKKKYIFETAFVIVVMFLISGCSNEDSSSLGGASSDPSAWLIPVNEVFDGGPGRDGIPSVDKPVFIAADDPANSYLLDNDLVVGIKIGNVVRAYPHPILDWHEIINDKIGSNALALTYCPLTGSAVAWNRIINGTETTFGVSGLLYNTNLIPYDRLTQSNWSQMRLQCVNGELIGQTPQLFNIVETTWKTWKELYPNTLVVSTNTGFSRPYGRYPYGDYRTNQFRLLFPVSNSDSRLPGKERVLSLIVDGNALAYRISDFADSVSIFVHDFNGLPVVAAGSSSKNLAVIFSRKLAGDSVLTFKAVQNSLPIILEDTEGNKWDIFGVAVSGPREGQQLTATTSFIAYWFALAAFYPDLNLFSIEAQDVTDGNPGS
ncbi:MAG: DUF3179 domain-containing protein [candidate division Zixibacteria bacterium]|nr:DUF3179 domain-containing protein [candidate division Zixibacteria bacterium]